MAFELAKHVDTSDTGGLGPVTHISEQARAAAEWAEFCKAARFKVGDKARIGGRTVTLTSLQPLTGGMVAVKGYHAEGSISGNYRPGDLEVVRIAG